jgi:hypothetical protein
MITGYYIRQSGDRWALIRQDEQYRDEVVLDGLPPERAAKLYWRYMRDFLKERARRERQPEPTLFELKEDARPASQKKAAGRFAEPTLFEL